MAVFGYDHTEAGTAWIWVCLGSRIIPYSSRSGSGNASARARARSTGSGNKKAVPTALLATRQEG